MNEHEGRALPREIVSADGEELFQTIRWPDGPMCPSCGETERIGTGHHPKRESFRCGVAECRREFSVTSGTPLEDTRLPLSKWVEGFHLLAMEGGGRGAGTMLERELDVTYKTAYRMTGLLRVALEEGLGVLVDPGREDIGFFTLDDWEGLEPLRESEVRTRIVVGLVAGPLKPDEVSRELDPVTAGPGRHHLRVLSEAGIVETDEYGRVRTTRPLPDEARVALRRYRAEVRS